MFGHQDEPKTNTGAPVVNDVSVQPSVVDDNPAASPVVGAPATDTDAGNFIDDNTSPSAAAQDEPASNDNLASIKQAALQQLSPLINHLDQSPEDKFRTTMMMIQAADDQSLIDTAYQAAQQISDEKAKAQALLDVVNEINYFTQHTADA